MIETVVQPDGFVAAAHVHPSQTERFAVAEGTLGMKVGGKELTLERRRSRHRRARDGAQVLERGRRAGPVRLRGAAGAPVRVAARDDVRRSPPTARRTEGDAEPAAARGDREGALRHGPASVPARLDAGRGPRARRAARAAPRVRGDLRGQGRAGRRRFPPSRSAEREHAGTGPARGPVPFALGRAASSGRSFDPPAHQPVPAGASFDHRVWIGYCFPSFPVMFCHRARDGRRAGL